MTENRMKWAFWALIDLFLAGLIIALFTVGIPAGRRFADTISYPSRAITVSAQGKATVRPDIALTSFGVVSRGTDPAAMATDNNRKITQVIEAVKKFGVDAKDVQTTDYNLHPNYVWDSKTSVNRIEGYELTQTVQVKIRDLGKANDIMGALTPLGVNQIGQLTFTLDDPESAKTEARKDAFEKARAKAQTMAQESGIRLGRVINVGENQEQQPIPYYAKAMDSRGMGAGAPVPAPTLEPGSQEVTVNVTITYEIE